MSQECPPPPAAPLSSLTLFLWLWLCELFPYYPHLLRPVRGGGWVSFPHLTSSMVVSGAEIKLYIRYSSRDPLTLYTSASQLILVAEGREKMVASLKDREQQG